MANHLTTSNNGRCPTHQKILYPDRKTARHAARRYPGHRLNAYPCTTHDGWHIGHLPGAVRAGRTSRDQIRTAQPGGTK